MNIQDLIDELSLMPSGSKVHLLVDREEITDFELSIDHDSLTVFIQERV